MSTRKTGSPYPQSRVLVYTLLVETLVVFIGDFRGWDSRTRVPFLLCPVFLVPVGRTGSGSRIVLRISGRRREGPRVRYD